MLEGGRSSLSPSSWGAGCSLLPASPVGQTLALSLPIKQSPGQEHRPAPRMRDVHPQLLQEFSAEGTAGRCAVRASDSAVK